MNSPDSPQSSAGLRFGLVLLSLVSAFVLVGTLARHAPGPARARFDSAPLVAVRASKPHYVLIGNSMVKTRFNERLLNRLLAPKRAQLVAQDGARSAIYYAMFKNYVVASGHRPRRVLIFFRDYELTSPRAGTTGEGALRLQRVSLEREPVIQARLHPAWTDPIERLRFVLGEQVPLPRLRSRVDPLVDGLGLWLAGVVGSVPGERARADINAVFGIANLRPTPEARDLPELGSARDEEPFSALVENSFLPDILALAEQAAIRISFVRVRRRAVAFGNPEPAELMRYQAALRAYLESRGIPLFDMANADWETRRFYGAGDHVSSKRKREYTRLFVHHLRAAFD